MDETPSNNKTAKQKKTRKRRHHETGKEVSTPKERSDSIITKHRITRNLGIYNKAKRSDTILRESNKQKVIKKDCQEIEQQMKKDLSKVLDVSSFRINSLGTSVESQNYNLPSNVLDNYNPPERNSLNSPQESVTSSLCGSAGDLHQGRRKGLAFKTPLQEISENLIDSLHPANTFNGRNYFSEVKEQILKIFKQSSANQMIEKHEIHSALHERLHIRKTGEPTLKPDTTKLLSPNHSSNNTLSTEEPNINRNLINPMDLKQHKEQCISYQPWDEHHKQDKPKMTNKLESPSSNVELFKQIHFSINPMANQTYNDRENLSNKNTEQFYPNRRENTQDSTYSKSTSTFDILDILDHTIQKSPTNQNTKYFFEHSNKELERLIPVVDKSLMKSASSLPVDRCSVFDYTINKPTTENLKFFPHQKDEDIELFEKSFPEVSPLKKPSLKTPTPPRFYRRKMF